MTKSDALYLAQSCPEIPWADGDFHALRDAGRRVIRVCLGDDVPGGLTALEAAVRG